MSFKIKRFIPESPLKFDPKNPYASSGGNNSKYSPEKDKEIVSNYSSYNPKEHSRVRNYLAESRYKNAQGRLSTVNKITPAPIDPSKPIEGPKQNVEFDTGFGKKGIDFVTGEDARKEVKRRNSDTSNTNTPPRARKKVKTLLEIGKVKLKTREINIGDQKSIGEKDVLDSTPKISTKKPTGKVAPKDNSRKAIKKRKTADKAAGVSKSQMRANKAKSKSEAALAKAKKSKNPDYRAQLKRKSDRLAKRANRKGNS